MLEIGECHNRPFITQLTEHLSNEHYKDALQLFQDDSHSDIIKENSWDIVPLVSSHISAKNARNNTELFHCCETILNLISEKCNPSETILELLEQIEHSENDIKFCAMFRPLSKVMQRLPDKAKTIEWCTSTIRSYIDGLDISDNNKADGNNENEENDFKHTIQFDSRVENLYNTILAFVEPLVQEMVSNKAQPNGTDTMKYHLASLLIFLLGKPFCYINEDRETPNFVPQLANKIVTLVSFFITDLLQFLPIVRKRANQTTEWKNFNLEKENYNLEIILFEFPENAPHLAYANFYFYVFTVPTLCKKVPHVYNLQYIFQSCLYLINSLLENPEVVIVTKGLRFMEHRLQGIEKYCITSDMLELPIYIDIIQTLVKIMIYCSSRKHRTWALDIFKKYFEIFDMKSRYLVISNLYKKSEHSGFLSLVTSLLKASVIECLQTVPHLPYFLGNNLKSLLKLTCILPHGSTSDLVELSDEIISNLNLLRFLFLRDRNNDIGIWNMVEDLDRGYLKPLREGISLCKAHWGVKMKDLEEQRKLNKNVKTEEFEGNDTEVTLIVGGEKLPPMSLNQKILFCQQAFNGLDIMECLLIRINECIASNYSK